MTTSLSVVNLDWVAGDNCRWTSTVSKLDLTRRFPIEISPEIEDASYCFTGKNDPVGSGDVTVSGGSMGVCHRSHSWFSWGDSNDDDEEESSETDNTESSESSSSENETDTTQSSDSANNQTGTSESGEDVDPEN